MNDLRSLIVTAMSGVLILTMLLLIVQLFVKLTRLSRTGIRTSGKVVSIKTWNTSHYRQYYPVVAYEANHQQLRFTSQLGNRDQSPRPVGEDVTVVYDPSNPRRAEIYSLGAAWGGATVISLFCLISIGLVILSLFVSRSRGGDIGLPIFAAFWCGITYLMARIAMYGHEIAVDQPATSKNRVGQPYSRRKRRERLSAQRKDELKDEAKDDVLKDQPKDEAKDDVLKDQPKDEAKDDVLKRE